MASIPTADWGDILLSGGQVLMDGRLERKDILVRDGKLAAIGSLETSESQVGIDCGGKIIIPGLIDAHVHMRDPGLTHKEDFRSGTRAAAAGGVTTVLDMPNTRPPTLTVEDLDVKRGIAREKTVVNFGFHFGASTTNLPEIRRANGVASTKIFMNHSTGDMRIEDAALLEGIFRASKMVMAHAEGENIRVAVELARKTGKRLHLAHISRAGEMDWLGRNKGANITCEVTPHHLLLDGNGDPILEVRPPLNTQKDKEALWAGIKSGLVDTIGSDHAPHLPEEKTAGGVYGLPGVETMLPLMLDAVNGGKLTLGRLVRLCSENPARIFNIQNKGIIKEGYDADLVVVDMGEERKVGRLFTKCGWSPYKDRLLRGWPETTIVGGVIVYDKGRVKDKSAGKEVVYIN